MSSLILLIGMLLIMMGVIWTVGEALKQDLFYGFLALIGMPFYAAYFTYADNYKKWSLPFFIMLAGLVFIFVGYIGSKYYAWA